MGIKAIIDIGSNSVRLIIYKINGDSTFKVLNEAKRTIRLGSYLTESDYLADSGLDILLNVLKEFKGICERYEVLEIYVVATEAIRRSINKHHICNKIKYKYIKNDIL